MTTIVRRILGILRPRERRRLFILVPLVVLVALLEVGGIASIMPFLALVGNPQAIEQEGLLNRLYTALPFSDPYGFLVFLGGVSLVALVVSNGFAAYMTWQLHGFANDLGARISSRLLKDYLAQPYAFFLRRNSSELSRNLLTEVGTAVNGVMRPGLELIAKGVASFFVVGLVFAVDPVLAGVAFVSFGVTYLAIFQIVKAQLSRIGEERLDASAKRFRNAHEAIGAVKDLKLMGREAYYEDRFAEAAMRFAKANTRSQVIAHLPRYALETVAFGGVLLMVISLLGLGRGLDSILPLIGVYAFAVYRLMPSLQTVFSSATQIRFSTPALEVVADDLESSRRGQSEQSRERHALEPLPFEQSLELRDVCFRYPGARTTALRDVSLTIKANTMSAFIGSTGAGKTTLVDLLLGLHVPDEGLMLVDGVPLDERSVARWQRNVGYVPQHIYLADASVKENIALGVPDDAIDMAAVERAARAAQIHEFIVNEMEEAYDTTVGDRGVRLSGGQRQRIGIARALYHDPKFLVFDEATSALDSSTERAVFKAIESLGDRRTSVVIAHRLSTIRTCDQVFVLEGGTVDGGDRFDALMTRNQRLQEMARFDA